MVQFVLVICRNCPCRSARGRYTSSWFQIFIRVLCVLSRMMLVIRKYARYYLIASIFFSRPDWLPGPHERVDNICGESCVLNPHVFTAKWSHLDWTKSEQFEITRLFGSSLHTPRVIFAKIPSKGLWRTVWTPDSCCRICGIPIELVPSNSRMRMLVFRNSSIWPWTSKFSMKISRIQNI